MKLLSLAGAAATVVSAKTSFAAGDCSCTCSYDAQGRIKASFDASSDGCYTAAPTASPTPSPTPSPSSADAPPSLFNIALIGDPNDPYKSYFEEAAARWSEIVVGDVPDIIDDGTLPSDLFGGYLSFTFSGAVDDLVIGYEVADIDGPGGILAEAGIVYVRTDAPHQPISAVMHFDTSDVVALADEGLLLETILHEMGHSLGIGSLWSSAYAGCVRCADDQTSSGSSSTSFSSSSTSQSFVYDADGHCPAALEHFQDIAPLGEDLLVENGGGRGTKCSHWDENQLDNEIMTGYIESSSARQGGISAISVGALEDLSYEVNYAAADPFQLATGGSGSSTSASSIRGASARKTARKIDPSATVQTALDGTRFVLLHDDVLPIAPKRIAAGGGGR